VFLIQLKFRLPSGAASLRGVGSCRYEPEASPQAYRPEAAFLSMIGHGHTQTNTDSKTLYKISVRVRLCGSVAILTAHKFRSHGFHILFYSDFPLGLRLLWPLRLPARR
jgi:hypothetical protein